MPNGPIKKISSFGASCRVETAWQELRKIEDDLKHTWDEVERQRQVTNTSKELLVKAKLDAVEQLQLLKKIAKNVEVRQRTLTEGSIGNVQLDVSLSIVGNTLNSAEIAKSMAKGTSVGISTALGTWALVGTFGSASTGTAIATLSGVAASNATLAWLGGGALAAGGGGMAAGAVVLGGIVLIPALAVMGVFSHVKANKKIAEIQKAIVTATEAIVSYKKALISLSALQRRNEEMTHALERSAEVFERQYNSAFTALFPWGIFSRMKRMVRHAWGRPFFDDQDMHVIAPLFQMAATLADLLDTKPLNEEGGVI